MQEKGNDVSALKAQASRAFAMKNYAQATKLWDDALSNSDISDADIALIHNNKAACHMVKKRWSKAVEECSAALEKQPDYVKALMRRAKAYESMKEYAKAQVDYGKAAQLGNEEAKAGAERVKKASQFGGHNANAHASALQQYQKMMEQYAKLNSKPGSSSSPPPPPQQQHQQQQQQMYHVDSWILEFIDLLKKHCGFDIEKPILASEVATEKLNEGMISMMQSDDPKVDQLLDEASIKFQEQAALGMMGQAHVSDIKADNMMQKAASQGLNASSIATDVERVLSKADDKLDEAIAYCPPRTPTMVDLLLMKSTLQIRRANLAANYLVEPVPVGGNEGESGGDATAAEAADEANKAALAKAFSRVTGQSAMAAEKHIDAACALIQKALDDLPEEEQSRDLSQGSSVTDGDTSLKAHILISLGNANYEASILRAAGGLDSWRSSIEKAKELFVEAGAPDADIRTALKGHAMAAELRDLIGEEHVSTEEKEKAKHPKGLPSLAKKERKKK
jgi:tetratricopeptide (TPR) repeat protein